MIDPTHGSPAPPNPAPWDLRGRGCVLLYRFPEDFVRARGFLPESLRECFAGGLGAVMLVDYTASNAGPYRELLFIPGSFRFRGGKRASITRILVSTEGSVTNGRSNWGIPKELARFEWDRVAEVDRVQVFAGDQRIASVTMRSFGPRLPLTTRIIPPGIRTLIQRDQGWTYLTTLEGSGLFRPSRLVEAELAPDTFPDFTRGKLLAAFEVDPFHLRFPAARISATHGRG